jgi:hypothetical protein
VPPPPPPTHTTQTEVTFVGAVHEYVPAVVYAACPAPTEAGTVPYKIPGKYETVIPSLLVTDSVLIPTVLDDGAANDNWVLAV